MMKIEKKEVVYTTAAVERLKQLNDDIRLQLQRHLCESREVPGDKQIEITASDVEDLARTLRLDFEDRSLYRRVFASYLLAVYGFIGFVLLLAGLFYPYIKQLDFDPIQLSLIITGAATALVSMAMRSYLTLRHQMLKMRLEQESVSSWYRIEELERLAKLAYTQRKKAGEVREHNLEP